MECLEAQLLLRDLSGRTACLRFGRVASVAPAALLAAVARHTQLPLDSFRVLPLAGGQDVAADGPALEADEAGLLPSCSLALRLRGGKARLPRPAVCLGADTRAPRAASGRTCAVRGRAGAWLPATTCAATCPASGCAWPTRRRSWRSGRRGPEQPVTSKLAHLPRSRTPRNASWRRWRRNTWRRWPSAPAAQRRRRRTWLPKLPSACEARWLRVLLLRWTAVWRWRRRRGRRRGGAWWLRLGLPRRRASAACSS